MTVCLGARGFVGRGSGAHGFKHTARLVVVVVLLLARCWRLLLLLHTRCYVQKQSRAAPHWHGTEQQKQQQQHKQSHRSHPNAWHVTFGAAASPGYTNIYTSTIVL